MTSRRRSRARRVLGVIGGVVGATVTFVGAAAAGVVIHLDMPATRRLVVTQVNAVLAKQLEGDVKIEALAGLGLDGIEGARVRVKDPSGTQVLFVDGLKVRVRSLVAAKSALFGKGDIRVPIPEVKIDDANVALDCDSTGKMRLVRAFQPKPKNQPPQPKSAGGRGVRIEAPDVVLKHAWAHGVPSPGAPAIDADVSDLAAHAFVDSSETRAGLDRVQIVTRGLPRGVDPKGDVTGKFRMPAGSDAKPAIEATFDGTVMGAPTAIAGQMNGDRIDATVDAHTPSAARIGQALGELPLEDELDVHAEAHGVLPKIHGLAHVAFGDATLDADADVVTPNSANGDTTVIDGRVSARNVDLSHIAKGAPPSDLGVDAAADVTLGDELHARVSAQTPPGVIARQHVPPVDIHGEMNGDAADATVRIHEKTLPTLVHARMTPEGGDRIVVAHVETDAPDLHAVPMLGRTVERGRAHVEADAKLALDAKTIAARVTVTGKDISAAGQSVGSMRAEARADGTLDRPVVDAALYAERVHAGGLDASKVQARSRVEAGKTIVLRDPRVDVDRRGERISASARSVSSAHGVLRVDGAMIEGFGAPMRADLVHDSQRTHVKVDAPAIDLGRVAKIAAPESGLRSGVLSLKGDVTLARGNASGTLHATLDRCTMNEVTNAHVDLDATLEDRALTLDLVGALDAAGKLEVHSRRLTLAGSPTDPAAWKGAHGRVALAGDLDMAKVSSLVPRAQMPFGELRGELVVVGTLGRDNATAPPEIRVHAHTLGLVIAGKTAPEPPIPKQPIVTEVKGIAPWRSDDVDLGADFRTDATSGLTHAAFRVTDREGVVVALDAKSRVPYAEILADPAIARQKLEVVPVSAKVVVPNRSLDRMPAILGVKNTAGSVEAELDVAGTPVQPTAFVVAHARGVRRSTVAREQAADADVKVTYDGNAAYIGVKVAAGKRQALEVIARVDARARDLVEGGVAPAWDATAMAKLDAFPLESVGVLSDRQIRGVASGQATLEGLHRDAKVAARLSFANFSVGKAKYESARIDVDAVDGKMTAKARFDQTDGFGEIDADAPIVWGAAVAPTIVSDRPAHARFVAKNFRAAAAQPFVTSVLEELDGRIDADAQATLLPSQKQARLEGKIAMRDGRIQVAAIGEELRDVRATVTMTPDGTIKVDDVYAKSIEGHLTADAQIKLAGMTLESAKANLHVPKDDEIDLAVNGVPIGRVAGDLELHAKSTHEGKDLAVNVDVPQFSVELPQSMKSGVQSLGESENIRIGVYRDADTLVKLPIDKEDYDEQHEEGSAEAAAKQSRTDIDVHLGRVEVRRGNEASAVVHGNPKIAIVGGKTRITGQVSVIDGWADVQGKKFTVQKGTVTFQGLPEPDPIVNLTAEWTAQDETHVFADFVGPVKTGKVHLRSEPPRPQNELLALVLFGTADGANPTPPPAGKQPNGTQKAAIAAGGGYAAQGLTEALDDLAGVQATARIDTTESNNPRPEVQVQLSPKVDVEFTHVIGTPPITEPPDKNLATIDWHFRPNWLLESTTGDHGRQLFDLIWQKRY